MFGTVVIKGRSPQDLATKIKSKLDAIVPEDYSISTFIDTKTSLKIEISLTTNFTTTLISIKMIENQKTSVGLNF